MTSNESQELQQALMKNAELAHEVQEKKLAIRELYSQQESLIAEKEKLTLESKEYKK